MAYEVIVFARCLNFTEVRWSAAIIQRPLKVTGPGVAIRPWLLKSLLLYLLEYPASL